MNSRHKKRLKEKLENNLDMDEKSVSDLKQNSSRPDCLACGTTMRKSKETPVTVWKCPFCGSVKTRTKFVASAEVKEANTGESL
ncbi:MAG: hypothetical protein ACOC80_09685 [Petrotogales bacterium]